MKSWLQKQHVDVASKILPLDHDAEILLFLCSDIICVHKLCGQYNGHHNEPFAQRLDLGWVINGKVCFTDVHRPTMNMTHYVCCYKINFVRSGHPNYLTPCDNNIYVKEQF